MRIKILTLLLLGAIGAAVWYYFFYTPPVKPGVTALEKVRPAIGSIKVFITSNGTVEPETRIDITPPIAGRIDSILVQEGQSVSKGQLIAWMSSTERAAMIDAAAIKGGTELKYWENMYKPTPITAPIDGELIAAAIKPGQSVSSATIIATVSDKLICRTMVDETDIGRVKVGQRADITLSAYPDQMIRGKIAHIAYESQVVSNVTQYKVSIQPDTMPRVFRSGMNATVKILEEEKNNILTLPLRAMQWEDGSYAVLLDRADEEPLKRKITIGVKDTEKAEITGGLTKKDIAVIPEPAGPQAP